MQNITTQVSENRFLTPYCFAICNHNDTAVVCTRIRESQRLVDDASVESQFLVKRFIYDIQYLWRLILFYLI